MMKQWRGANNDDDEQQASCAEDRMLMNAYGRLPGELDKNYVPRVAKGCEETKTANCEQAMQGDSTAIQQQFVNSQQAHS